MSETIAARVGLVQRVLPAYRAPFFDLLAQSCANGLSVFFGQPREDEALGVQGELKIAVPVQARNVHIARGKTYLCWQRGLTGWLEHWDPRVLIVEANPRYLSTPQAQRWMKSRRRPVIGWGLGIPLGGGWLRSAWRKRLLSGCDARITYRQPGAAQYRAAGFPAEHVFTAPNAVTRKPDAPAPQRAAEFVDGRGRVLFVGRLQARKRIDLLLRACARLPEPLQPRLAVVGDGPERAALEALAGQVYPRAEFTGDLRGEALARRFSEADLFALPGTGGLAVQQAMSFALPVLVAEADGTQADLVREGNGRVLPPGDEDALVAELQAALSDPARLRQMGQESYRIVAEEINLERMVKVFAEAIASTNNKIVYNGK